MLKIDIETRTVHSLQKVYKIFCSFYPQKSGETQKNSLIRVKLNILYKHVGSHVQCEHFNENIRWNVE